MTMSAELPLAVNGILACILAFTPVLYVACGWAEAPVAVFSSIGVLRAVLLLAIGVFVRPWPLRIVIAFAVLLFIALDVLAITGVWNVYEPPWRENDDFIYFQF
jgi:hypothetical protein